MIRFDVDWQDARGVRDPVLARTWCALTVRVGDEVVTRVFDNRTRGWRNSVHGAVFPLCAWLVDNFWLLLNEPYRWAAPYGSRDLARGAEGRPWVHRHSLLAAREGGALPDLTLFRDGDAVVVRWLKDGGDASHPFLRFVAEGQVRVDPLEVRQCLREFVESVLARVADLREPEVAQLRDDWSDLVDLSAADQRICMWAARLGLNAHYDDELSEESIHRLASTIDGLEPTLASDLLDVANLDAVAKDIEWLEQAHGKASQARRGRNREGSVSAGGVTHGGVAYNAGYGHARALRQRAGMPDEELTDLDAFVSRFGWADTPTMHTSSEPASPLRAVVDYSSEGVPFAAWPPLPTESASRFRLARSLFLHASSERRERRLVTAAHTWDQRASRAFAAELLAPAAALQQRIRGDAVSLVDVEQLADEFLVDQEVIERQIRNHSLAHIDRGRDSLRMW